MFSLTLYKREVSVNPLRNGFSTTVKTTMMFRNIANPRRTTLAHLEDAEELQTPEQPEHSLDLPAQTANPRRTVLMEIPAGASAAE
ncbi:hypothetical protein GCM10010121_075580 [Streptomyces brasiliensis]|uniref:Uncharacterized protein n=1 Tax=Streptomyces brasiliensis TaxID=1954 RepID=A0A917LAF1_9ACTN|nr:hypothetical protein GCM10010121_075580 [Streptomyces brasiliensis]